MDKKPLVISIGSVTVLLFLFGQLFYARMASGAENNMPEPRYHLKIITEDTDTFFYSMFERGANAAAVEQGVFVEYEEVDAWGENAFEDCVKTSIYAEVDALAFQTNDLDMSTRMSELAQANGVEVLLYESDNYQGHQDASVIAVGSNSYSAGTDAGRLALQATGSQCKAVLVVDRADGDRPSTYQNMKIQGVLEVFADHEDAEIVETFTIGSGYLDGETLANTLMTMTDSFNCIICLHERTTPLLAQRIIDSDLLGSVTLIGYGALPQTLEYIGRNVIYGTICPNAEEIGYKTVSQMCARLDNKQLNDYSSVQLFTITSETLDDFRERWGGGDA